MAEAQWLHLLFRDAVFGDVKAHDWIAYTGPFSFLLTSDCELTKACDSVAVTDARRVFEMLTKNTAGSKNDRRNMIELAVLRDNLAQLGSQVRWVPHARMPPDCMTKADPVKGNIALYDLIKRATLTLIDEAGHLDERSLNAALKSRSRGASLRALDEETCRKRRKRKRDRPVGSPLSVG